MLNDVFSDHFLNLQKYQYHKYGYLFVKETILAMYHPSALLYFWTVLCSLQLL